MKYNNKYDNECDLMNKHNQLNFKYAHADRNNNYAHSNN